MSQATHSSGSRVANVRKVDRLCDDFEAVWQAGQRPQLEAFLARVDGVDRPLLLRELLEIEIHQRRQRGEFLVFLDFKDRFAEWMTAELEAAISSLLSQAKSGSPKGGIADENGSTVHLPNAIPPKSNRYSIVKMHARGGMGEVWLADDLEIGRRVAYKRIRGGREDAQDRFFSEAQITGQLEHPGIVPVHELGHDVDGNPFYVMRLVQGRNFKEVIAEAHAELARNPKSRDLCWLKLLEIFVALCRTVAYAHHRGVIHRDIKPDNIMIGTYGETLVIDWGLAKVLDLPEVSASRCVSLMRSGSPGSTATQDGNVLGSPHYMSPEMAEGRIGEADIKTDIYLLGATLYQLLTNRPPRQGSSNEEIVNLARSTPPTPPRKINPAVPGALDAICLKAMAHGKTERYESAQALAEEIERYLAGESVRAYREPWSDKVGRWIRRHKRTLPRVAAVASLLLIAGGALLALYEVDQARTRAIEELTRRDLIDRATGDVQRLRSLSGKLRFALADTIPIDRVYSISDPQAVEQLWAEVELVANGWQAGLADFPLEDRRDSLRNELAELALLRAQSLLAGGLGSDQASQLLKELDGLEPLKPPGRTFHLLRAKCANVAAKSELAQLAIDQSTAQPFKAVDHFLEGERLRMEGRSGLGDDNDDRSTWKPSPKHLRDAIAAYQRCVDLEPNHFWSHLQKGRCHLLRNEPEAALAEFNVAVALRPEVPWAWSVRGFAQAVSLSRDFRAAEHDLDYALQIDAKFTAARLNRGALRLLQGQLAEAKEDFQAVLASDRKNLQARYYLALAEQRSQNLTTALELCDSILDDCADLRAARWLRIQIDLAQGNDETAREDLDQWLRKTDSAIDLTSADAAARRSQLLRVMAEGSTGEARKRTLRLALDEGQAAIAKGAKTAAVYSDIATHYLKLGKHKKAIEAAGEGLRCQGSVKTLGDLRHVRGLAFVDQEDWERAKDDFRAEAAVSESEPWAQLMRADAHALLGYIAAKEADPLEAQRQATEAVSQLRTANHYSPWINLGCVYNALADKDPDKKNPFQDTAMTMLRHAMAQAQLANLVVQAAQTIRNDPALRSLQARPDYDKVIPLIRR